ncbi:amino acid ABC transporter permease [Aquihabitans sp. McL0605]|uniref:amino acid ABC transporter permease n=1 Tax=Aquihabitans sp. McL0605 TaxID=3415671 RepID=UPI003CF31FA1
MTEVPTDPTPAPEAIRAVPVRHPGRWVSAAIVMVVAAQLGHWLFTNEALGLGTAWSYVFDHTIVHGVIVTLELTAIAMVMGIVLGVVLAIMRLSKNPIVAAAAWVYIWFFRGTPVLVQLLFWFNLPSVVTAISVGIPFGPSWLPQDPKALITAFAAACLGLGLNEGAYMAEIARAGILSVDEGQDEAACALGMSRLQTMRRIILPQAMRVIIPPTGNETISMLKTTSLAVVIGVLELLGTAQAIYARTYEVIPLLLTASIWYLFMTSVLSVGQYYLERRFARGSLRNLPPTPRQRLQSMWAQRSLAR